MPEFIVATTDIEQLKKELAASAMAKKVMELTVSSSESTQKVWFLAQEALSGSMGKGDVIHGLASLQSAAMENVADALIEQEDSILVLGADFN